MATLTSITLVYFCHLSPAVVDSQFKTVGFFSPISSVSSTLRNPSGQEREEHQKLTVKSGVNRNGTGEGSGRRTSSVASCSVQGNVSFRFDCTVHLMANPDVDVAAMQARMQDVLQRSYRPPGGGQQLVPDGSSISTTAVGR